MICSAALVYACPAPPKVVALLLRNVQRVATSEAALQYVVSAHHSLSEPPESARGALLSLLQQGVGRILRLSMHMSVYLSICLSI